MASVETKSWSSPDGSMTPDKTHAATINFGGVTLTKANMQPGWKWSECIKPHVGTESCQAGHVGVLIQGQIHVVSDDGSEVTVKAGDAYCLAPVHRSTLLYRAFFFPVEHLHFWDRTAPPLLDIVNMKAV